VRQLDLGKLTGPAGQVFARVNEAWGVLGDDARRAAYLSELASGGADAGADEAKMLALLAAEEKFRLGEMAMRRSHFSQALEDFDKAVELNPAEGEHHAMAAWVRWMDARDKDAVAARVKRQFRKAIELSPLNPSVFYYRGKLAKDLGDDEAALYCFEKTLSLDAKHEPAFREKNAAVERLAKSSAGNK
jgi:tetratricopeptide (TPR) repeat protein